MKFVALPAILSLALAGGTMAQTTSTTAKPAAAKPAAVTSAMSTTAKPKADKTAKATGAGRKPMTEAGKACSAQADAKNLHGKDREKFRRACLRDAK
ncbi:MAG: hypothetical protein JOZ27_07505 [Caulobacteraceae bacterium]|nr:hypothetical protein [Caulobacteraceae bacterium]